MYVRRRACAWAHACVPGSEVASHKEKPLKAPLDLHLLFISMFPDMFFFPRLADLFPLIVSSKWRG